MAALREVRFVYETGIQQSLFGTARLSGSWDAGGAFSEPNWSVVEMSSISAHDGCPAFEVSVVLFGAAGQWFRWGVQLTRHDGTVEWGIPTEVPDPSRTERFRSFQLSDRPGLQIQRFKLCTARELGAQKYFRNGNRSQPEIRFSVWAPNAQDVQVCIGNLWEVAEDGVAESLFSRSPPFGLRSAARSRLRGGFISGDGDTEPGKGWFAMSRGEDAVWTTDPSHPALNDFAAFDHVPYMFRVVKDNGAVAYRTDLYSRCQVGQGDQRPTGPFVGSPIDLDGTVSCSAVVDPDRVTALFNEPIFPETQWVPQDDFFRDPPPHRALATMSASDLIIYELHVGALGYATRGPDRPGTLRDAIDFLYHLEDLGVTAVELLPLSEFGGRGGGWGYATSHYFALEYSGGGRDKYKWFVRECHRRGLAVIMDVVYNHYNHDAERAEWLFDTDDHGKNPYYWYEGRPEDYPTFNQKAEPQRLGHGGYVNNDSTGYAPRYHAEMVRRMFVDSALALVTEFGVDGFRLDQTTSIRSYNVLVGDGRRLENINAWGAKLIRELTGAVRLVRPRTVLMAEDHDNWDGVASPIDRGGLGFDATWYADYYHHLVGDTNKGPEYAKLINTAGLGDDRPLAMSRFAGALQATAGGRKVVYHESHDEAGNGELTDRTIQVAVNGAPLFGETRRFAEARCRFAAAVTLFSAGIPMFLFGEEVGAEKKFLYGQVLANREDLIGLRRGAGRFLFEFYRSAIRLRRDHPALRSPLIDVVFAHDLDRLLVFRRWCDGENLLVVASLNNRPFTSPHYAFHAERVPRGRWQEIFSSDAAAFNGDNVGNGGATVWADGGWFQCVVPANGVLVFQQRS